MLKSQQRFKSKRHNISTGKVDKIALISNDEKKMQSFNLIEAYSYETNKYLVNEKEKIKCHSIIKRYKKQLRLRCYKRKRKRT